MINFTYVVVVVVSRTENPVHFRFPLDHFITLFNSFVTQFLKYIMRTS